MIVAGHKSDIPTVVWESAIKKMPDEIVRQSRHANIKFIIETDDDGEVVAFAVGETMTVYYVMAGIYTVDDCPSPNFMAEGMRQLGLKVATLSVESDDEVFKEIGFVVANRLYASTPEVPLDTPAFVTSMDLVPECDWPKYEMLMAMDLEVHKPTEDGRGYEAPCRELFKKIKANPELAVVKLKDGRLHGIMMMMKSLMRPDDCTPLLQADLYVPQALLALPSEPGELTIPDELLHYATRLLESQNKRMVIQSEREDGEIYLRDVLKYQYIYSTCQYYVQEEDELVEATADAMDDPS